MDVLRSLSRPLAWLWGAWPIIMVLWFLCAVWVVVAVKHATHKALLQVLGNGVFGTLIVSPFVLCGGGGGAAGGPPTDTDPTALEAESPRSSPASYSLADSACRALAPLRQQIKLVLLISVLGGLERNLTNAALYSIGGSLKTALHGFNVLFVFVLGGLVPGVDARARLFLLGGQQGLRQRCRLSNLALLLVLLLLAGGGVVTAVCGPQKDGAWRAGMDGIALQVSSGVVYALKYVFMKLLLGHGHQQHQEQGAVRPTPPPTKAQVALVAQPVTGLIALAFLPIFEDGDLTPPALDVVLKFALSVTGILVFELQLVQLTSPLTVSVMSALHNVVIVLFFVLSDGESLGRAQAAGFAVSTVGVLGYALVKQWQQTEDARVAAEDHSEPMSRLSPGSDLRSKFVALPATSSNFNEFQ